MRSDALDFELPEDRIATEPAQPRDAARLMVAHRDSGRVEHARVRDLPRLGVIGPGDLMVVNRTAVVPARFEATRQATGGRVRGLYLGALHRDPPARASTRAVPRAAPADRPPPCRWRVLLEARGRLRAGERLALADGTALELLEREEAGRWVVYAHTDRRPAQVLGAVGQTPLPPYIRKARRKLGRPEDRAEDTGQYNTVYADQPGSVAAPTAGLHFTADLLARLEALGVERATITLHVGQGTFAPVRTASLEDHAMHTEPITVPPATLGALARARASGGRVLAVGTTSARALESLPDPPPPADRPYTADTDLFIRPGEGFVFRYTDLLLTNFHLPRSTLLAMVAALPGVGIDRLRDWYAQAVRAGYRFYSYGDAMLVV